LLASENFKDVATKYQEPRHRVQAIVMGFDSTLAIGLPLRELCVQFFAKTTKKCKKKENYNFVITSPRPTGSSPLGLFSLHLLVEVATDVKSRTKKRQSKACSAA
jgi:hypothetical protein